MALENYTVGALVRRAIDGDQYALKMLYTHYAVDMFNISFRMTGNREDAEDVVQESFITAFKKLKQVKDPDFFGVWLRQIVIHNCVKLTKKRLNLQELPDHYEVPGEEDAGAIDMAQFAAVNEAIRRLPEGCRQVFLLYTSEDYTHKEIGALLNIAESTSKSQYLRAKKLLLQQLKQGPWTR